MQRIFLSFLFSFLSVISFAQVSAHASASATIVYPVGVTDISATENRLPVSSVGAITKSLREHKSIESKPMEITSFKIIGASTNLISLSVPVRSVKVTDQAGNKSFFVDELEIRPAATNDAEIFMLNGKPKVPKQLFSGSYVNEIPVAITIDFN